MIRFSFKSQVLKNSGLSFFTYAAVFGLMSAAIGYLCYKSYGINQPINWVLTGIYMCLSVFSYYVFMVNDMYANNFKDRATALGFLSVHLAMTVLVMSFIFNTPIELVWYLSGIFFCLSYLFCFYGISRWAKNHRELNLKMQKELLTDELTQLYNRRALAKHAKDEELFAREANSPLSVMVIDIDDFKPVNDRFGHSVGDELLRQISTLFQKRIGESGEVYRWGGEEFVVLLPVTGLFEANQVANKLVNKIAAHTFDIKGLIDLKVTVSIGVAQWSESESISKSTIERADKALYKAKASGKNKTVADFKDNDNISEIHPKLQNKKDQAKLA